MAFIVRLGFTTPICGIRDRSGPPETVSGLGPLGSKSFQPFCAALPECKPRWKEPVRIHSGEGLAVHSSTPSKNQGQEWGHRPVIPVLRRLSQEHCEFQPRLDFIRRPSRKPPPPPNENKLTKPLCHRTQVKGHVFREPQLP